MSNNDDGDKTTLLSDQKSLTNTEQTALESMSGKTQVSVKRPSSFQRKTILPAVLAVFIILASSSFFYFSGRNQSIINKNLTATDQNNNFATRQARNATNIAGSATSFAYGNATATSIANGNATATSIANGNTTATSVANGNVTATSIANGNATATSVANGNVTPTPNAGYPPLNGILTLNDPLSDNSHGYNWYQSTTCFFSGGAYHDSATPGYATFCFAQNTNFSNFAYEVQMTIISGDCGGIYFRIGSAGSYFLRICHAGYYDFSRTGVKTLAAGVSPAINNALNQTNLVAILASNSTISLFVNHQYITQVNDNAFSQGQIGVVAEGGSLQTEVVFSNAKVWKF